MLTKNQSYESPRTPSLQHQQLYLINNLSEGNRPSHEKSNQLSIQGKMTTDYGEPYPYMSFVTGKDLGDRIDRSSKTLTSDSTATFDLTIDYKEGDDLFIFGVGSYVLKTTIEIK